MTEQDFLIRIAIAMVCGGLIGLNRQLNTPLGSAR
jgi:uncharacterized membrane protein YhiD involved in acid resistance